MHSFPVIDYRSPGWKVILTPRVPTLASTATPPLLNALLPRIPTNRIIKGALEMAVVAGSLESVKLLLEKGVNVEEKNGGVPAI